MRVSPAGWLLCGFFRFVGGRQWTRNLAHLQETPEVSSGADIPFLQDFIALQWLAAKGIEFLQSLLKDALFLPSTLVVLKGLTDPGSECNSLLQGYNRLLTELCHERKPYG